MKNKKKKEKRMTFGQAVAKTFDHENTYFSNDFIGDFIRTYLPEGKVFISGVYAITNPYSKQVSYINEQQATLVDYIMNYANYCTADQIQKGISIQNKITEQYGRGQIMETLDLQSELAQNLEKWNAARYMISLLWPDLYMEQID